MSDEGNRKEKKKLPKFLVLLRALTPIHAGAGSEAISPIDLPIQREKHTGWPTIYGSSIKGALRAYIRREYDEKVEKAVFGARTEDSEKFPGLYTFSDAKVLLFPVKSYSHVYLYVTCPMALERLKEDAKIVGIEESSGNISKEDSDPVYVLDQKLEVEEVKFGDFTVYLEKDLGGNDDECKKKAEELLKALYQVLSKADGLKETSEKTQEPLVSFLNKRIVILNDLKFTEIVRTQTMVVPRVKLGPLKTTNIKQGGNLWYEEYLPPDTVMYFLAIPMPLSDNEVENVLKNACCLSQKKTEGSEEGLQKLIEKELEKSIKELQKQLKEKLNGGILFSGVTPLGGKETIGKGLISLIPINSEQTQNQNQEGNNKNE